MARRELKAAGGLFLLALVVRLVYLEHGEDSPFFSTGSGRPLLCGASTATRRGVMGGGQALLSAASIARTYSWLMSVLLWKIHHFAFGLLGPLATVGMVLAWRYRP